MALFRTLVLLVLVAAPGVYAGDAIRLKTGDFHPHSAAARTGRHWLLQFASRPTSADMEELACRGIRVLSFVPDTGLMVAAQGTPDLHGFSVVWRGPMEPHDKISPAVETEGGPVYLALFHPDVDPETARSVVARHGLMVLETPGLLPAHLLVSGSRVLELASEDEVAYVLPARAELALRRRVYGCPGPITAAGPVADYALMSTGWPKDASGTVALQYFLQNLTPRLDGNAVRSAVTQAFSEWSRYSNVTFSPGQLASGVRSIDILFASGPHGDGYPFTGTNILAHTFYPYPMNTEPMAGDIHFNSAEAWQTGSGIDLFSVALHEAGHALGLGHSDHPDSVMYPYYKQLAGLSNDDIAAVQALYGTPSKQPVPPTATNPTPDPTPTPAPTPSPTKPPSGGDTVAPSITIVSPSRTIVYTTASSIAISGTASDNVGVTVVTWSTSAGGSGTAAGTLNWSAVVPLLVGTNTITVRACDAAGNCGWRATTVVRQ